MSQSGMDPNFEAELESEARRQNVDPGALRALAARLFALVETNNDIDADIEDYPFSDALMEGMLRSVGHRGLLTLAKLSRAFSGTGSRKSVHRFTLMWKTLYETHFQCKLRVQHGVTGINRYYFISQNIFALWEANRKAWYKDAEAKKFPTEHIYHQFWPRAYLITAVAIHMMLQPICWWLFSHRHELFSVFWTTPSIPTSDKRQWIIHKVMSDHEGTLVLHSRSPPLPSRFERLFGDDFPIEHDVPFYDDWAEHAIEALITYYQQNGMDNVQDVRRAVARWGDSLFMRTEPDSAHVRNGIALGGGPLDEQGRTAGIPLASVARKVNPVFYDVKGAFTQQIDNLPANRGIKVHLLLTQSRKRTLEGVMRGQPEIPGTVFYITPGFGTAWPYTAAFHGGVVQWCCATPDADDIGDEASWPEAGLSIVADLIDVETLWRVQLGSTLHAREFRRLLAENLGPAWHDLAEGEWTDELQHKLDQGVLMADGFLEAQRFMSETIPRRYRFNNVRPEMYMNETSFGVGLLWQACFLPPDRFNKLRKTAPPTGPRPAFTLEELLHTNWLGYTPGHDPVMLFEGDQLIGPRVFNAGLAIAK